MRFINNRRATDHYTAKQWLVHWPLMGGQLHLVQRGEAWAGCGPAQSPLRCTKCNGPPINGQCTNFILLSYYQQPTSSPTHVTGTLQLSTSHWGQSGRHSKPPPPSVSRALASLTVASSIALLGQWGRCPTSTRFRRHMNKQKTKQTNRRLPSRKAPTLRQGLYKKHRPNVYRSVVCSYWMFIFPKSKPRSRYMLQAYSLFNVYLLFLLYINGQLRSFKLTCVKLISCLVVRLFHVVRFMYTVFKKTKIA